MLKLENLKFPVKIPLLALRRVNQLLLCNISFSGEFFACHPYISRVTVLLD